MRLTVKNAGRKTARRPTSAPPHSRTLAAPEPVKDWSLTSLKKKLIKIGAKVISHGRYAALQMAKIAIPRNLLAGILRLIAELRHHRQRYRSEALDCFAFDQKPRGWCVWLTTKPAFPVLGAPMALAWMHGSLHVKGGSALPKPVESGNLASTRPSSGGSRIISNPELSDGAITMHAKENASVPRLLVVTTVLLFTLSVRMDTRGAWAANGPDSPPEVRMRWQDFISGPDGVKRLANEVP
jgi:hypothetical protein